MQLAEQFASVVLIDTLPGAGGRIRERLQAVGNQAITLDLTGQSPWRDALTAALKDAKAHSAPGVLIMLSDQNGDEAFWRAQDALTERLALRKWDVVYIGHGEGAENDGADQRPSLVHCDMPPRDVSAIAVSFRILEFLIGVMPDHGVEGPLAPADWLAVACWLAIAHVKPEGSLAAWPPLMHRGDTVSSEAFSPQDRAPVDFGRKVHCLLGLPFDAVTLPEAAAHLDSVRALGKRCFLSTPNLNFTVASLHDSAFRNSVCRSDLSVADGMPLIWMARMLGIPLPERVSGSNLFDYLRQRSREQWNVFFFGGQDGAGKQASRALADDASNMHPAGHISPGFGNVEQMSRPEWIEQINSSQADMVVVSLGSAKGQAWIDRNLDTLHAPIVTGLGAVVNFVAGTIDRAPRWMQRCGLEWLWRIKEEPYLWRRYYKDASALLRLLITRVLPLALIQRLTRENETEVGRAYVSSAVDARGVNVKLGGAWSAKNIKPIRLEFERLYGLGRDVTLDLSDCTWIDSAFLGLVLLLDAALRDRSANLKLSGAGHAVNRLIHLHGADHLVTG
jgi:N-acetylglucosaminyldiphosphoundecaprenol N-acetyl-beta-D-mannosaminyltransferase